MLEPRIIDSLLYLLYDLCAIVYLYLDVLLYTCLLSTVCVCICAHARQFLHKIRHGCVCAHMLMFRSYSDLNVQSLVPLLSFYYLYLCSFFLSLLSFFPCFSTLSFILSFKAFILWIFLFFISLFIHTFAFLVCVCCVFFFALSFSSLHCLFCLLCLSSLRIMNLLTPDLIFFHTQLIVFQFILNVIEYMNIILFVGWRWKEMLMHIERILVKNCCCCRLLLTLHEKDICNFYLIVTLFAHDSLCLLCCAVLCVCVIHSPFSCSCCWCFY